MKKVYIILYVFLLIVFVSSAYAIDYSTDPADYFNDTVYVITELVAKSGSDWLGLNGNLISAGENICTDSGWTDAAGCLNLNYVTDSGSTSGLAVTFPGGVSAEVQYNFDTTTDFAGSMGATVIFSDISGTDGGIIFRVDTDGADIF